MNSLCKGFAFLPLLSLDILISFIYRYSYKLFYGLKLMFCRPKFCYIPRYNNNATFFFLILYLKCLYFDLFLGIWWIP